MSNNRDKELQVELAKEEAEQQLKDAKHAEQIHDFLKKQEQAQKMTSEGNYKEARERILEPLLKSLKTNVNFGKHHSLTLNIKFEVGVCFYNEHDYKQAKAVLKDALKSMGKKNKLTITAKFLLANCLKELKQNKEALAMFMELLPVQQAVLGRDHDITKQTEMGIAILLVLDKTSRKKGLETLESMLAKRIKEEGQDGQGTIDIKMWMAYVYQLLHDKDKCLALHKEILASQEKTLGKDHEETKEIRRQFHNLMNDFKVLTLPAVGKCAPKTHIITNFESILEIFEYYKPVLTD